LEQHRGNQSGLKPLSLFSIPRYAQILVGEVQRDLSKQAQRFQAALIGRDAVPNLVTPKPARVTMPRPVTTGKRAVTRASAWPR